MHCLQEVYEYTVQYDSINKNPISPYTSQRYFFISLAISNSFSTISSFPFNIIILHYYLCQDPSSTYLFCLEYPNRFSFNWHLWSFHGILFFAFCSINVLLGSTIGSPPLSHTTDKAELRGWISATPAIYLLAKQVINPKSVGLQQLFLSRACEDYTWFLLQLRIWDNIHSFIPKQQINFQHSRMSDPIQSLFQMSNWLGLFKICQVIKAHSSRISIIRSQTSIERISFQLKGL